MTAANGPRWFKRKKQQCRQIGIHMVFVGEDAPSLLPSLASEPCQGFRMNYSYRVFQFWHNHNIELPHSSSPSTFNGNLRSQEHYFAR
jgi:hypothetical protein